MSRDRVDSCPAFNFLYICNFNNFFTFCILNAMTAVSDQSNVGI